MSALIFLIEQVAIGLYIFIGLGILWNLRKIVIERQAYYSSPFELERDLARYRRANAATTLILLIEVGLVVFGIQRVVAPTLRDTVDTTAIAASAIQDLPFHTPTPAPLSQVNIDSSGIDFEVTDPSDIIRITPTPTEEPPGTIEPNAPTAIGCESPNAFLKVPANGMVVHQVTQVIGTAYVDNFSRYKLELSGPYTNNQYATMQEGIQPVEELGNISIFNPIGIDEGWYLFRLAVFDNFNEMKASCAVNIFITAPIPTETPIPLN